MACMSTSKRRNAHLFGFKLAACLGTEAVQCQREAFELTGIEVDDLEGC